jgi:multicomponent Na+:H+ antiporter subunit E
LKIWIKQQADEFLLANSITLTPGTLTVLADGNRFLVHALTFPVVKTLKKWPLIERIKEMEKG